MNVDAPAPADESLRAEIGFLATLLVLYSAIKIAASSLAYVSALVAVAGVDEEGGHTLYWIPQVLFYTLFFASARRLRRFDRNGRRAVISLSALSLAAAVLYTVLDFAFGPGRERPALAFAIKLRLLIGGDVWDVVFPLLAILWLRTPATRQLFERE